MDDIKKQELEWCIKFKQTGDKTYFQKLYESMKPLIYKSAEKAAYGSNLPQSAHKLYAAQVFLDALRTFDPKAGAALNTHIFNAVQNKTKRLNYEYQNLGSIPEPRAQLIGVFQNETANLREELGREPSAAEIADRMKIGIKDVTRLQKEITKDLSLGEGTSEVAFSEGSREEETLNFLYYDLNPEEKVLFEYITGRMGKPRLVKPNNKIDFDAISKKTNMSTSKLRNLYASIRNKLEKVVR